MRFRDRFRYPPTEFGDGETYEQAFNRKAFNRLTEDHFAKGEIAITNAPQSSVERRSATRYKMGVSARFRWNGRSEKKNSGRGTVRDMSVQGVFILSSTCPKIGARIDIEIARPGTGRLSRSLIKARMKVLRIERGIENETGFAAHGRVFIRGERGRKGSAGGTLTPFVVRSPHDAVNRRASAASDPSDLIVRALALNAFSRTGL